MREGTSVCSAEGDGDREGKEQDTQGSCEPVKQALKIAWQKWLYFSMFTYKNTDPCRKMHTEHGM